MIAAWMVYVLLVSACCTALALVSERVAALFRLPRRGIWIAALLGSMLLQAVRPTWSVSQAMRDPPSWSGVRSPAHAAYLLELTFDRIDGALLRGWAVASGGALLFLVGSILLLRRHRRGWRRDSVDGCPVLISAGEGPGVVGAFRGTIVVPSWVAAADEGSRRLIIEHEREHIRGRDPLWLLLGLAGVVVMPWNPFLWWQLRRLRVAIELDCDARVLSGREAELATYGQLLLEVGRRHVGAGVPMPAFSESASALEVRLLAMTAPRASRRGWRAGSLVAAALVFAAAAWSMPNPMRVECEAEAGTTHAAAPVRPGSAGTPNG